MAIKESKFLASDYEIKVQNHLKGMGFVWN